MSGYLRRILGIAGLSSAIGLSVATTHAAEESQLEEPEPHRTYYVEDIKSTMMKHIRDAVDDEGVFDLQDDITGERLALKFVRIHDPVRQIGNDIYFACTDFHVVGKPDKLYDLDFWMDNKTGELKIYRSKVHKEPRWSLLYGWYKQPRYTFVNDEIEYLY